MKPTGTRPEDVLLERCDDALQLFGDTARGALWPSEADRRVRFDAMLDVVERTAPAPVTLCDFGCGTGELLAHLRSRKLDGIRYVGVDRSAAALALARAKFPDATFLRIDVGDQNADLTPLDCDYLVACGVFTAKWAMTHDQMWSFLTATIRRLWPHVRRGLAFNVMSKIVDWEREDLFHVPMDDVARLLHEIAGRNVRFRADYGLYEYTAYARRQPVANGVTRKAPAVPVMRPRLPPATALERYLRRMDVTRVYTNHGPLLGEFQERVCDLLRLPPGAFVGAASGTAALVGAILATAGRATAARPFALLPSFTFVATAIAVEQCGYRPYLVDVDPETWMLDPRPLLAHPVLRETGVVVPVAPFGRPVPHERWRAFCAATSVPVVVDGASSFDRIARAPQRHLGEIPVALSFHATKAFATGEGGGVATSDLELAKRVTRALNFGFFDGRDSAGPSMNGKMSEYHAAVGLAELDGWPEKRAALERLARDYRSANHPAAVLERLVTAPAVSSTYVLFHAANGAEASAVEDELRGEGIETRRWYGGGIHAHSHFSGAAHDPLPVSERLASCIVGLPVAPDLSSETLARVVAALERAVAREA